MKNILVILTFLMAAQYPTFALDNSQEDFSNKHVQSINNSIFRLHKRFEISQDSIKVLRNNLGLLDKRMAYLESQNEQLKNRYASSQVIDSISSIYDQKNFVLRKSIRSYSVLLVLFVLVASGVTFYVLKRIMQQQLEIEPQNEFQVFFSKIKSALNRQIKAAESTSPPPGNSDSDAMLQTRIVDHELPIRVGEEVFRMRMRLSRMPQETKGLTALLNAVNRLEDELNIKGYKLIDLSEQPYYDEMTVAVKEFIPQDDMPMGKKKILRMLKPQIKYMDTIISFGEAEVAMSSDDLAQT